MIGLHRFTQLSTTQIIALLIHSAGIPTVDAVKDCDTTSKVSTKSAAFHAAMKCGYEFVIFVWKILNF